MDWNSTVRRLEKRIEKCRLFAGFALEYLHDEKLAQEYLEEAAEYQCCLKKARDLQEWELWKLAQEYLKEAAEYQRGLKKARDLQEWELWKREQEQHG